MPADHRPAKSVRVLLAEDGGTAHGALALLLRMEPDLEIVAQVASGDAVLDAALTRRPDVALLEVELSGMSGLEAAAVLRDQVPDCRVLILATSGRPGHLQRAIAAGAAGFLVRDGSVEELASAIRRVLTGETVIDPVLAAAAQSVGPPPLTSEECASLRAAADGTPLAESAARLHLSEAAVTAHLAAALAKTGTSHPAKALREARRLGWV
ncbi:response regulator [Streptomyces prasinus]|uniref:response regulator n=1 Tax=Streptomyces prasinus TaxID=67345 RepID=UPI002F3E5B18